MKPSRRNHWRAVLGQTIRVFTMRCEEHRRLAASQFDRPLTMVERCGMLGHRIACGPCRQLVSSLQRMDEAARQIGHSSQTKLDQQSRERIRRELNRIRSADDES